MRTLKDVAGKMAAVLAERGHAVGTYCDGPGDVGAVCALGALNVALRGQPFPPRLYVGEDKNPEWVEYEQVALKLAEQLKPGRSFYHLGDIVSWSDANNSDTIISTLREIK